MSNKIKSARFTWLRSRLLLTTHVRRKIGSQSVTVVDTYLKKSNRPRSYVTFKILSGPISAEPLVIITSETPIIVRPCITSERMAAFKPPCEIKVFSCFFFFFLLIFPSSNLLLQLAGKNRGSRGRLRELERESILRSRLSYLRSSRDRERAVSDRE